MERGRSNLGDFGVKSRGVNVPQNAVNSDIYSFAFGGSTLSSPQIGNFDVSPSSFIGGG